jgi:hypothetical protein
MQTNTKRRGNASPRRFVLCATLLCRAGFVGDGLAVQEGDRAV